VKHMGRKQSAVSLVGRRLPDNENLGIACLMAALRAAGFEARFHVLNGPGDMDRVACEIGARDPGIVGFSMQDGGSSYLPIATGIMLRRRGYTGHVTCGGPFATLAREWLLDRYGWIDSVVRFAGEIPIVELARKIRDGSAWSHVPGLTTRAGDGAPAPVLDALPMRTWPERGELPEVVGYPVANVAASRGCLGRCAYCGPAALQDLEVREGLAGGASRRELACGGVGGARWRDIGDLCNEMARLWHERGVRYFSFVDEHPLPWSEEAALERLSRWRRGLRKRGVGGFGMGMNMRADRITPRIATRLVETGLTTAFVGLELADPESSARFGRPCMADHAARIVDLLESLGVATASHVMLLHPYSTPASIRAGISLLGSMRRGVIEATRMQVYHGTKLHRLMLEEGTLRGNPLRYSYACPDGRVQRFDEILARLRMEAFGDHSVAYGMHDVRLALALRERLEGRGFGHAGQRCEKTGRRLKDLQARALGEAFELAMEGVGFAGCSDLVQRTRAEAALIRKEIEDLSAEVSRPGSREPIFSGMRAAAATALRIFMLGAPLTACYASHDGSRDGAAEMDGDGSDEDADVLGEATDARPDCTTQEIYELRDRVEGAARDAEPCFSGAVDLSSGGVVVDIDSWNAAEYCPTPDNEAVLEERKARVKSAVEALDLDPGCEVPPAYLHILVRGQDVEDELRLHEAVREACPDIPDVCGGHLVGTVITVDADGRVVDVGLQEGCDLPPEALECIRAALEGMTFPCLARYQICPEPVVLD
jgi:hypothetical protein